MSRNKLCVTEIKLSPNGVMVPLGVESQALLPEEREHSSASPKGPDKGTTLFGELLSLSQTTERKEPPRRTARYGNELLHTQDPIQRFPVQHKVTQISLSPWTCCSPLFLTVCGKL